MMMISKMKMMFLLIFGLQEEAREKIKQEETKVLVYLSKFTNLFVQIDKIFSLQEDNHKTCLLTKFNPSPIHRDNSADVFVQMAK